MVGKMLKRGWKNAQAHNSHVRAKQYEPHKLEFDQDSYAGH